MTYENVVTAGQDDIDVFFLFIDEEVMNFNWLATVLVVVVVLFFCNFENFKD